MWIRRGALGVLHSTAYSLVLLSTCATSSRAGDQRRPSRSNAVQIDSAARNETAANVTAYARVLKGTHGYSRVLTGTRRDTPAVLIVLNESAQRQRGGPAGKSGATFLDGTHGVPILEGTHGVLIIEGTHGVLERGCEAKAHMR